MVYKIATTKRFDKEYAKLSPSDREIVKKVINRLAKDEVLEPKYKDHPLKGDYLGFRDCHVKPDLVLIYSKKKDALLLTAFRINSHSELF
ncbi:MAG: type II toxin-antitoxin system YafQ family toxin [Treponema sp.]|nr:type II toxin-antitoxin system YafQ family toxin [Spirochaetales bacterium]MDY5917462.1 type II toxin-antitoxin system YafQ family toxin [Treponema sp.]MDY6189818.1 type II toxin-antitoxin system YafQ family toxin [Treponema sp.]